MHYRSEVDGLRAIAVIPVILFHMDFEPFAGGFVGVDVFFVISGFLITSLILSDMDKQRFNLLSFYERRARRILPALLCVMLLCIPLAWVTMVPFQLHDFSQSLITTIAFASNILFFIESGYFEPEAELKPLLHTWSLAVEEQYYIVFPVIVLFLAWLGRFFNSFSLSPKISKTKIRSEVTLSTNFIFLACCIMALSSFAWSQWNVNVDQNAAFFLLPSRGWEILAGALAAVYLNKYSPRKTVLSLQSKQLLSSLGILCIVAPIFLYDDTTSFPAMNALLPVAGVVLVLLYASPGTLVHIILSQKFLVGIGLVSYSAYLWHQPLIAFARLHFGMDLSVNLRFTLLAITGLLSILSWRFIETPARQRTKVKLGTLMAMFAAPIIIIGIFAFLGLRTNGFYSVKLAEIPPDYMRFIVDQPAEIKHRLAKRDTLPDVRIQPFESSPAGTKVLIIGDSISDDLVMSLNTNADKFQNHQFRRLRLDDTCVSVATATLQNRAEPSGTTPVCRKEVSQLLNNDLYAQADEVVLHTNFQIHNTHTVEPFVHGLITDGKKVTVIGLLIFNDLGSVSMKLHRSNLTPKQIFYENLRSKYLIINDKLKLQVNNIPGARYLDKLSLFCFHKNRYCDILDANDNPIFIDGNHMSLNGHIIFGRKISEAGWF